MSARGGLVRVSLWLWLWFWFGLAVARKGGLGLGLVGWLAQLVTKLMGLMGLLRLMSLIRLPSSINLLGAWSSGSLPPCCQLQLTQTAAGTQTIDLGARPLAAVPLYRVCPLVSWFWGSCLGRMHALNSGQHMCLSTSMHG